ncbi:MAG: DNA primase [Acetatifactor sp.]
MFYPEELVEEVRSKNDIVDVVSGYVRLQKKGANHWGCCPFHNEKTPSFAVNGAKQMYHCFGCGAGGNVYTFVMNYENYSFPEAVKMLAERAGVTLPEIEYDEEQKRKQGHRQRLLDVNREAATFFYYQLRSPQGEAGYRYLSQRALSDETMRRFGLGYAGKSGAGLIQYLKQKGFEDKLIIEAGLGSYNERTGLLSQFWNRVMYPIQDIRGKVIGFGGRVMGDGEPKYLNSPETPIFDKRRNLYGLNFARTARSGNIILCEGYMDVIAMHQAGFTQAVASLGTAFTAEQAMLLKRYTDNVLLAYDSDGAGVKAALRGIGILRDVGLSGKIINMQPCKDPDEFIKKNGREAFQERIDQAENSFFFEIRMLERDYDLKDPESKTLFYKEIAKKLCGFSVDVERENYLEAIAEKYHIGFENLRRLVGSYAMQTGVDKPPERPRSGVQPKNTPQENSKRSQRLLLTWIVDDPALYPRIARYVGPEDFTEDLYRQVAEQLFRDMEAGQYQPASIISRFQDEEQQRRVAELFNTELPQLSTRQEREKALHDIVYAVKKNSYEQLTMQLGSDVTALSRAVSGKKALEELAKTHISLE